MELAEGWGSFGLSAGQEWGTGSRSAIITSVALINATGHIAERERQFFGHRNLRGFQTCKNPLLPCDCNHSTVPDTDDRLPMTFAGLFLRPRFFETTLNTASNHIAGSDIV